jgi:hypothetical protein
MNQPLFASGFNSKPPHIRHILLYQLPQNFRDKKNSKRKRSSGKHKYWQKSVKTEQLTKVEFLEGFLLLKSKSVKLMKVWI